MRARISGWLRISTKNSKLFLSAHFMQGTRLPDSRSECSSGQHFFIALHSLPVCKLMGAHLATVAARNKATKFVKIIGDQCIPDYPDRNLPTLLIYGQGDMKAQLVGAAQLGGMNMKPEGMIVRAVRSCIPCSSQSLVSNRMCLQTTDIEAYLRRVGAIKIPESRTSKTEEVSRG